METLTTQNYFLGHMEAHQHSQTPFLITQTKSIFPSALFKKKSFKCYGNLLHCTVAVHHMTF